MKLRTGELICALSLLSVGVIGAIIVVPRKERYVRIAEEAVPKTVCIYVAVEVTRGTETYRGAYAGSGVFISHNNHILSCAHLFNNDGKITGITVCKSNHDCVAAELLALDTPRDLSLLQANFEGSTPSVKLADPRSLAVGEEVIAVGNPLELEFSVCHGIISALNRDLGMFYNLTQSDAMINPGNSGGPLFNLDGELVGINNCVLPVSRFVPINSGLSFSVSPGQIIEFITNVRKKYMDLPAYNLGYFN